MKACPNCGWSQPVEPDDPSSDPRDAAARTQGLARVGSVAEAGYLVALLQEAGVSASAHADDSFSAVQGAWNLTYVVSVPTAQRALAVRVLQAEANEGFSEIADRVFDGAPTAGEQSLVNPWRMITVLAVVAAAGALVAADTLGRGGREAARQANPRGGAAEPIDRMAGALRDHGTPFRSDPVEGGPRRMLRFLPQAGAWELLTDADRDGRYESRRRFSDPQVAPQAAAR